MIEQTLSLLKSDVALVLYSLFAFAWIVAALYLAFFYHDKDQDTILQGMKTFLILVCGGIFFVIFDVWRGGKR